MVTTDTRWGDGKTRKLAPQIQLFSWTGGDSSPKKNVPRENNALLGCEIFRGSSHQKGDEASENVSAAQPWRFHSGMGGGSTLNFKGSTPRAHCDPVENTSRHDKARWSWSSPILLVCFPMCLIKPILASQTPCLVFVEGDILSLLLLTLANFLQRLLEGKTFSYLLISQNISIISHTTILVGLDHQVWWF